ncbi:MAG: DUF4316 domain-containing protein [bacterium]|nr:DUF4316 domain-containing protein [bacterium]
MAENKKTETIQPTEGKKTNKQRLKDITDSIENGIKDLFESDKYKQYLQTMSRFHRYSVNNQMLIYMQKPNATHVAGFNKWRDQFGRNVKKGEKGIKIIAPTPFKKKVEETKLDPDTKLPMLDDNGKEIKVEKEIQIPMFRVVSVFDVSQTDGKPLPQLASDLSGNVENYEAFFEAIRRSSAVPITFEPIANADGYFSLDEQKIVIREGMSEVQTVSALLHELAHSKLHNTKAPEEKLQEVEVFGEKALFSNGRIDGNTLPDGLYCYDLRGSDNDPGEPVAVEKNVSVNHAGCIICAKPIDIPETGFVPLNDGLNFLGGEKGIREFLYEQYSEKAKLSRNTEEVQAESISFAVCAYYGIKTEENSFGYIASWSKGKELSELKSSLETINKTSNTMITDIDKHYAEVKKERGLDNEQLDLDEAMFENSLNYLHIQRTDNAWDYSIYDKETLRLVDGGRIDNPDMKLEQIKEQIIAEYSVKLPYGEPLPDSDMNRLLDDISEKALSQMSADLPDPNITQADMNAYGYDYEEMLPLTRETAQKLFETNAAIYMLHPDNTEAMVIDSTEISHFDGVFGIEKEDWEAVKDNYLKNAEMSVEDDFDMIDGVINNGDNKHGADVQHGVDGEPTVAELESDVKAGKSISLLALANAIEKESKQQKPEKVSDKKPSLLAKLNRPLPPQDKKQNKFKEREM